MREILERTLKMDYTQRMSAYELRNAIESLLLDLALNQRDTVAHDSLYKKSRLVDGNKAQSEGSERRTTISRIQSLPVLDAFRGFSITSEKVMQSFNRPNPNDQNFLNKNDDRLFTAKNALSFRQDLKTSLKGRIQMMIPLTAKYKPIVSPFEKKKKRKRRLSSQRNH